MLGNQLVNTSPKRLRGAISETSTVNMCLPWIR